MKTFLLIFSSLFFLSSPAHAFRCVATCWFWNPIHTQCNRPFTAEHHGRGGEMVVHLTAKSLCERQVDAYQKGSEECSQLRNFLYRTEVRCFVEQ